MRVIIADNHNLLRAGLQQLLGASPDIDVVKEASNGEEAVAYCEQERPDVVIMDLSMPGMDGLEATRQIRVRAPGTKVIMLTRFGDFVHLQKALDAGAAGYVLKSATPDHLLDALKNVGAGRTYIDNDVLLPRVESHDPDGAASVSKIDSLTRREAEILKATASGESSKEIAWRIGVSVRTVEFHKYKAMKKLELRGRPALVRLAVRVGWLT